MEHWNVNERIRHFGSPSNCELKKRSRTHNEWQICNKSNSRTFSYVFSPIQLLSLIYPASFDQNNTQSDNDIYVSNICDVNEKKNDNIDLDYFKEKNNENTTINTDEQLSESEITILGELYKIIEKNPEEATQHLLRSDLLEKV